MFLKIINTFLKIIVIILKQKLSAKFKNGIKIFIGQVILQLLIQHAKHCFDQ